MTEQPATEPAYATCAASICVGSCRCLVVSEPKMPEIFEDEDGETLYIVGHSDRVQVRVAIALYTVRDWLPSDDEAFGNAIDAAVTHEWFRPAPTPENDELMARCGPDDEGADPFTVVRGLTP